MYRSSYGLHWRWSATLGLMAANLAVFIFQCVNAVYFRIQFEDYLSLSHEGLAHGYIWQLLTFQFLHFGKWHFFCNMLGLFFLGRAVEQSVGAARMLEAYFASGVIGGLFQAGLGALIPGAFGMSVMGASAGVCGLLAVYALLIPEGTILLWFVVPVPAKFLLVFAMLVALFFVLVPVEPGVAHAAHLGGMIAGVAYVHWFLRQDRRLFGWWPKPRVYPSRELVNAHVVKRTLWHRTKALPAEDLPPSEFISQEVDPILDKISAHGIQSLTQRERQILEAARRKMAKR